MLLKFFLQTFVWGDPEGIGLIDSFQAVAYVQVGIFHLQFWHLNIANLFSFFFFFYFLDPEITK